MPRIPRHDATEFTRRLRKAGFIRTGQSGSHEKWFNEETNRTVVVKRHAGETFGPKLMSVMLSQAGITVDEYIALANAPKGE
jgi:predicted RNA binding protein YcfA (HicA-like mRNA interferase family)